MRLNDVAPQPGSKRRRRRVGRGIAAGQGASCGFGMRGQKSRSGRPTRPGFEGGQTPLYRRVPKLKYFTIQNIKNTVLVNTSFIKKFSIVKILECNFFILATLVRDANPLIIN